VGIYPVSAFPEPGSIHFDSIEKEAMNTGNPSRSPSYSFRTYSYRENLFNEFEQLLQSGRRFDGLIIDLVQIGYSLPLEVFIRFETYAKRLLKPQGVLLFVKADGAITLSLDNADEGLVLQNYDSPFGIFAKYPLLADYVCATVSGIDRRRLRGGGSTLANHILYTSIPVLRKKGLLVRDSQQGSGAEQALLQLIDNYSSVESLSRSMERQHNLPADETIRLLHEFEADALVYPLFNRIQFLANCYHNRRPFNLGQYLQSCGLVSGTQLQELLELQSKEDQQGGQKNLLGLLAVRKGYCSIRQLEVMLHDQYLYGGHHSLDDGEEGAVDVGTMHDTMIGSLGAIDTAGLLQSIAGARKTGLLTIEQAEKSLVVAFAEGKPTQARLNNLSGYEAIVEFLVSNTEGIFVFREKGESKEFNESCSLNHTLDRLLLDSALYQDQVQKVLTSLPGGNSAILERVWNYVDLWQSLSNGPLQYMDETPVGESDKNQIQHILRLLDGMTSLKEVAQSIDWPTYKTIKAIQLLIDRNLAVVQRASVFSFLKVFQRTAVELQKLLGREQNQTLLETSLRFTHGGTSSARRFYIDYETGVSINLSFIKKTLVPASTVLLDLRRWMDEYLNGCRRQLDSAIVDEIIDKVRNNA
jgi:hypothetical protein